MTEITNQQATRLLEAAEALVAEALAQPKEIGFGVTLALAEALQRLEAAIEEIKLAQV